MLLILIICLVFSNRDTADVRVSLLLKTITAKWLHKSKINEMFSAWRTFKGFLKINYIFFSIRNFSGILPRSVYYKFCCTCTCFSFLSLCPYLPISSVLAANQSQYKETDLGLITIFICKSVLFHLTKVKVKAFFVTVLSSCDVLSLQLICM